MILRSSRHVLFLPCASFATNGFSKIIIISTSVPQHRYKNTNRLQRNIDTKTPNRLRRNIDTTTSHRRHRSIDTPTPHRQPSNIDTTTPHQRQRNIDTSARHWRQRNISSLFNNVHEAVIKALPHLNIKVISFFLLVRIYFYCILNSVI